jgi:hypothetical protein
MSSSIRFAPTEKFCASFVITKRVESCRPRRPVSEFAEIKPDDVRSRASSSWSGTRCSPPHRPDRSAMRRNFSSPRHSISSRPRYRPHSGWHLDWLCKSPRREIESKARPTKPSTLRPLYHDVLPAASSFLDIGRHRTAFLSSCEPTARLQRQPHPTAQMAPAPN